MAHTVGLDDVRAAAAAIAGQVVATPTLAARQLSDKLGCGSGFRS